MLSVEEVARVLGCLHQPRYRACLTTIYACGLRIREGVYLQVGDIDGSRRMLHVRKGKGGQDRYVPLPQATLELLRTYWRSHRHPLWLFSARPSQGVTLERLWGMPDLQKADVLRVPGDPPRQLKIAYGQVSQLRKPKAGLQKNLQDRAIAAGMSLRQ